MNNLKKSRKEKKMKQKTLAQEVKISVRALQNYESDERVPDVHTAQRFSIVLDKDLNYLFPLSK